MSLTKASYSMITGAVVNALDFGADPTGVADSTNAIQNAINSLATSGGVVRLPVGTYAVTSPIQMSSGVSLIGDGYFGGSSATAQKEGTTTIIATHTGNAILNLKGCVSCTISDLSLDTSTSTYPKTGMLLGRTSTASAGYHNISRVSVYGYFSVAAVYSIASEDNVWENLNIWLYGGAAKYCFYTSTANNLSVDTLTTSSNIDNVFIHPFFINASSDSGSACIYMETAQQMGSWSFIGGYLTANAGSYVRINTGSVDGLSPLGPFTFVGTSGERLASGNPSYGFNLTTSVAGLRIPGLTITGCRFDFQANTGGTIYLFSQASNLCLLNPNIVMQPPEASPYANIQFYRNQIMGGIVDIGRSSIWNTATLNSGWSNTYGTPPYAAAAYQLDQTGYVNLRGTVTGGTGTIFTLPSNMWPTYNMLYSTISNGAAAQVLVDTSGNVTLQSGSAASVDLTAIRFDINYQY